jgi:hypothetical protein
LCSPIGWKSSSIYRIERGEGAATKGERAPLGRPNKGRRSRTPPLGGFGLLPQGRRRHLHLGPCGPSFLPPLGLIRPIDIKLNIYLFLTILEHHIYNLTSPETFSTYIY